MSTEPDLPEGSSLPDGERLPALPRGDHECIVCGGTGQVSTPGRRGHARYHLERGWKKRYLITEIAKGEKSESALARELDCHRQSIRDFKARHAAEIEKAVRDIEDQFVGLWVADKVNRLAEYQQDIEDANVVISEELDGALASPEIDPLDPGGDEGGGPIERAPLWIRLKHQALRAAAEELGQIPNRVRLDVAGRVVTYAVEGVDMTKVLGLDLPDSELDGNDDDDPADG